MQIGDLRIDSVVDGAYVADPASQYREIPLERWADHQALLDAEGRVVSYAGGYLVRDGEHVVLVDAGVGREPQPPFRGGALITSLEALGVAPGDVTHVLLTHLHFDHIGWVTDGGDPVFPNARHVAHAADWRYFYREDYEPFWIEGPEDRPIRRLAAVADRIELQDSDGPVLPGIHMRHVGGHTPGSVIFELTSNGERGALIGDVAHNPVELLEPDWQGVVDLDPERARRVAIELAGELEETQMPFAAAHFPGMAWGRIKRVNGRLRWVTVSA